MAWQAPLSPSLSNDGSCVAWRRADRQCSTLFWQAFDTVVAISGSTRPLRDARSEEGKQFAPVANYRSYKQFAISPRAGNRARKFRSHFSQENTPIHLLYPQGKNRWSSLCVAMRLS